MKELGLNEEDYGFYLDLRKYGTARHAGFGLGFERMIMYLTGMSNIRDVIPFPRTVNNQNYNLKRIQEISTKYIKNKLYPLYTQRNSVKAEGLKMYNILVCDDDREIVEAIEIYLSKEGYNVIKAYDGLEAIEILKKKMFNYC